MNRNDRKHTKTHEWIVVEGDLAVVGITDHAQQALGDITFVELPNVGDSFEQGAEFGVIESVKAASDLYVPVTGDIAEVNETLAIGPELVNQDAYGEGWLIKLSNFDVTQLDSLLSTDEYDAQTAEV
jgi:glycine cleavage system H protein